MAGDETFLAEEIQKFQITNKKLNRLVFKDTAEFRSELTGILNDFNLIEYSLKIVDEEVAGEALATCCYLVTIANVELVAEFCQVVINLISKQQLVLVTQLSTITEFLIKCLRGCPKDSTADLLGALSAVLYENTHNLTQYHEDLVGENGILVRESESPDYQIQRNNTQCLENICLRIPWCTYLSEEYQARCYQMLLSMLHRTPEPNRDDASHCRRMVSCIRGIHNLVTASKTCPLDHLGPILAALRVYMLYGLPGQQTSVPPTLYPRTVPLPDPPAAASPRPAPRPAEADSRRGARRGRKKTRGQGRARAGGARAEDRPAPAAGTAPVRAGLQGLSLAGGTGVGLGEVPVPVPVPVHAGPAGDTTSNTSASEQMITALLQPWRQGYSSESDMSDTEGGQAAKLKAYHSNIRHCSLGCLHAIIKIVEKRTMFGYWSSFLPDGPVIGAPTHGHTLFTCIMSDPSPKARSGALVVLSALVEGSKQYLAHADDSDQSPVTFTPFSITLGYMVKELHRGLLFALAAENAPLVLTQIFKCLAVLIPNVPYQKLRPGLLNRIIKHVKPFLSHREPNIRVACLTCLGSIVSVQAPMMEVWQALQATPPTIGHASITPTGTAGPELVVTAGIGGGRTAPESGYVSGPASQPISATDSPLVTSAASSQPISATDSPLVTSAASSQPISATDSPLVTSAAPSPRVTSGAVTPTLSSGCITPSLRDGAVGSVDLPWIVRMCINNVASGLVDWSSSRSIHTQPQPVKLESLQLLALLSKGYFMLIRNCILVLCELVQKCLEDTDPSIQLHGAKLLEELAAAILIQLKVDLPAQPLDITQVEEMWVRILSGSLPRIIQEPAHYTVRATACDCLANIGPQVFERLKVDKRVLCMTLLLGFTADADYHVRASAVRVLGVYVLYPSLRDDVAFVADVANAIINALQEPNLGVKVKAAWSLGNLSDALVLNKNAGEVSFVEDFADMLLLKLLEVAVKASQDNDKVKANAVRGLGSLLRYLPPRSFNSVRFSAVVVQSIKSLVKTILSGTMKIRWNACYATANMFRNQPLPLCNMEWTNQVHYALASVVRTCKNFKVRINAAVAFSVPRERRCYGHVTLFRDIWVSLVLGLIESEAVADFAEFKYKDSLMDQVCRTLFHLTTLMEVGDLEEVGAALEDHIDALYPHLERFYQQPKRLDMRKVLEEEVQSGAAEACQHLRALKEEQALSEAQNVTVTKLLHLLESTRDGPMPPGSRPGSPPTAFSQTFD